VDNDTDRVQAHAARMYENVRDDDFAALRERARFNRLDAGLLAEWLAAARAILAKRGDHSDNRRERADKHP
jgi:hypothetical protein